jgi:hypothetical protein
MGLDPALAAMMTSVITLEPAVGRDKYGKWSYGPPVTVHCYLMRRNVKAVDDQGEELTSVAQLILAEPETSVSTNDRLTLPDGTQLPIVEVLSSADETGSPYYLEVRA